MIEASHSPARRLRHRLIVIDDHPLMRRGLASMINNEPDLEVCAEAATHHAGMAAITSQRPDLATVEITLGSDDGLELIKDIRGHFPALPVLVISMHDESLYAERAFRAGALGYVTKQQIDETVLIAIRCVLQGGQYMSPALGRRFAKQYFGGPRKKKESPLAGLSDCELTVFRLIGEGKGTRQIAEQLKRSIKTIESHRENLKAKLTLHSGAELTRAAVHWAATGMTL